MVLGHVVCKLTFNMSYDEILCSVGDVHELAFHLPIDLEGHLTTLNTIKNMNIDIMTVYDGTRAIIVFPNLGPGFL